MEKRNRKPAEVHCYNILRADTKRETSGDWLVVIDGVKKENAYKVWRLFQEKYGQDHMIAEEEVFEFSGNLAFRMPEDCTQAQAREIAGRFNSLFAAAPILTMEMKKAS